PPATVTTMVAGVQDWQPEIRSVGTLRARNGVEVVAEIAGTVQALHFKSGDAVKAGELLIELDADEEQAQLDAAVAAAELAKSIFERDKAQFKVQAVSQAQLDLDAADVKVKQAEAARLRAVLGKMHIRAPFAGRLGVSALSPGQYVRQGEVLVSLQANNPVLVDFSVPQRQVAELKVGQRVLLGSDAFKGRDFIGEISAIDSRVNASTRNVRIEAKVDNPKDELLPGMYAEVRVQVGESRSLLTLPQTAISFNAYGSTVFLARPAKPAEGKAAAEPSADGKPAMPLAEQVFVKTGLTRGDQIVVESGINEGDLVVTSGQMKLKNGTPLIVNNSVQPAFESDPAPQEQ
ncbi:MAG TPA: efflux transporter periplasmic adaptor subunit, partial [Zetaproteobacteria bacterium]|nr:efflux transporter periplasmic adaptor subunit [Zetaproteobacteria bacterium]